jgi:hypothetical protein
MYVWGTPTWCHYTAVNLDVPLGALNGESLSLNGDGFSIKYKEARVPHRLIMPDPIRTVRYFYKHICNPPSSL